MNTRERILAGGVAGVLLLAGGHQVIKRSVIEPRTALKHSIAVERERREELETKLLMALTLDKRWEKRTRHTLPNDIQDAALRFREDVNNLLRRNRLSEGVMISTKSPKRVTKGPRSGFVDVPVYVKVEGTLRNAVNFLNDFYQRPYHKRVDSMKINAPASEVKTRSGASRDPKLTITMTLTTLVLPDVPGIDAERLPSDRLSDPRLIEQSDLKSYLHEATPVAYNEIHTVNLFKLYEPPPPPPPPPARTTKVTKTPKETKTPPPPPVDPRRDAHKFVLIGTTSMLGEHIAYVEHQDRRVDPPVEYHLNDRVDDGQLVLVHGSGIVVRVATGAGPRRTPKTYFYPIGKSFAERVEVNPRAHPEISRLLSEVFAAAPAEERE